MQSIGVNQFLDYLKTYIGQSINHHETVKFTRRGGEDFVVMSCSDFHEEQETLYVLENQSLMQQIVQFIGITNVKAGCRSSQLELDALHGI